MASQTDQIRRLERKYRRKKRTAKWEAFRRRLPLYLVFVILTAAAAGTLWFLTKPRTAPVPAGSLRVFILDVGQGDAALLCTDSHSILIDGGEPDRGTSVVQMIKAAGVQRLDCVINSHPHADHIGGLAAVLEQIPVGALYLPEIPEGLMPTVWSFTHILDLAEEKQIPVRTPACGEILPLGAAELEFLSTDNAQFEELNDCSLVCRVTCGARHFLFTGDLSEAGEQAMLDAGLTLSADVLKAGHHGSSHSTTPAFLDAVKPEYAAISCGALNDYGHPAEKTLRTLHETGCAVYRTDLDGSVLFETDGSHITVTPDYEFGLSGRLTYHKSEEQIETQCP